MRKVDESDVRSGSPLEIDSLGMWALTAGLPEQIERALGNTRTTSGLPHGDGITSVAVLGMGGSGIAGDVLAAAGAHASRVPIVAVKSYELPAWVTKSTLVFAVSCSGDTEETLEATGEAITRGAPLVAITSGGRLAAMAGDHDALIVDVPPPLSAPRAAIGSLSVPPLVIAERLGLLEGVIDALEGSIAGLQARRDRLVQPLSLSEELAERIGRTIPLFHGAQGLSSVAASRWKTQVNENAKAPAVWSAQPELSHNEIAGWAQNGDVTRQILTVLDLRTDDEHPQVKRRFRWVGEMLEEVVADVISVWAEGSSAIARFFDLVLVGDFLSLHLARKEGIDPGPVPILGELKGHLAG
ncbi:MAG: bifunctional phosphoglucose/phosphomannose isomerase [Acidimicrobiales bacterium]